MEVISAHVQGPKMTARKPASCESSYTGWAVLLTWRLGGQRETFLAGQRYRLYPKYVPSKVAAHQTCLFETRAAARKACRTISIYSSIYYARQVKAVVTIKLAGWDR